MDESAYERLAGETFRKLLDLFEDVDPDVVDVEQAGDVVTMACENGQKLILNTQRPARQLWLAGGRDAWHFNYDAEAGEWRDDKRPEAELFATIARLIDEATGVKLDLG